MIGRLSMKSMTTPFGFNSLSVDNADLTSVDTGANRSGSRCNTHGEKRKSLFTDAGGGTTTAMEVECLANVGPTGPTTSGTANGEGNNTIPAGVTVGLTQTQKNAIAANRTRAVKRRRTMQFTGKIADSKTPGASSTEAALVRLGCNTQTWNVQTGTSNLFDLEPRADAGADAEHRTQSEDLGIIRELDVQRARLKREAEAADKQREGEAAAKKRHVELQQGHRGRESTGSYVEASIKAHSIGTGPAIAGINAEGSGADDSGYQASNRDWIHGQPSNTGTEHSDIDTDIGTYGDDQQGHGRDTGLHDRTTVDSGGDADADTSQPTSMTPSERVVGGAVGNTTCTDAEYPRVALVGDVVSDSACIDSLPNPAVGSLHGLDMPVGRDWDNLQTLLELHDMGEPVRWPNGFDARTAALVMQHGALGT
jgi:hypothetical protein